MRKSIILLFLLFSLFGCKTNPINQKINKKREGLWIEQYALDSTKYKSVGEYHNGDLIKKWRYYVNGKINKKEKYKHDICLTTFYHENGKIQSQGKTKLITTDTDIHWFYFDDWRYYDEKGKLITVKKYENGEFVSETKSNKQTIIRK